MMYLVRIYKDETGGVGYCVDDNFYCVGLYTTKEKANGRVEELVNSGENKNHIDILELKPNADIQVYSGEKNFWDDEDEDRFGFWLGGGQYYE